MSLRPRYSLMTFLLFTAALAVGMKLWRGPHLRTLHFPHAGEQQEILDKLGFRTNIFELGLFETHLEYINHFDRTEFVVVRGISLDPDDLYLYGSGTDYHVSSKDGLQFELSPEEKTERIVSWLCWPPGEEKVNQLRSEHAGPCGNPFSYALGRANQLYIISNHGRIFTAKHHAFKGPSMIDLIEPDSILDPAIRSRVLAEASACAE